MRPMDTIIITGAFLQSATESAGAFRRAFGEEMRGATEQAWYDLLREVALNGGYGTPRNDVELRAEAKRRTDAGQVPPGPCIDSD